MAAITWKLAGVQLAPLAALQAKHGQEAAQVNDLFGTGAFSEKSFPMPRLPAAPVIADGEGRQFILLPAAGRFAAAPFEPQGTFDPASGDARGGGFVALGQLAGAGDTSVTGYPSTPQVLQAAGQALFGGAGKAPPGGDNNQEGSNAFVDMAKSLAQGLPQSLAGMLLGSVGGAAGGSFSGVMNIVAGGCVGDLAGKAGANLAGQALGMLASMGLNKLWSVDDSSSTAEHVAHKLAEQFAAELVNQLQSGILGGAASGGGAAGDSLPGKIWAGFNRASPMNNPALRVTSIDTQLDPVLGGSGNVFVEGLPMARETDSVKPPGMAVFNGAKSVLVNTLPAGRSVGVQPPSVSAVGDFVTGALRTYIGGPGTGTKPPGDSPLMSTASSIASAPGTAKSETVQESEPAKAVMCIATKEDGFPGHAHIEIYAESDEKMMSTVDTYGKWPQYSEVDFSDDPLKWAQRKLDTFFAIGDDQDIRHNYWDKPGLDFPDSHYPDRYCMEVSASDLQRFNDYVAANNNDWTLANQCADFAIDAFNETAGRPIVGPGTPGWSSSMMSSVLSTMPADLRDQIRRLNGKK